MLDPFEASIRWKKIKEFTDKILDPVLKSSVLETYKQRAIDEWGYCPDGKPVKKQTIQLDEYENNLLKRIKAGKEYGVFVPDKSVNTEFRVKMRDYITKGGKFSDLPKELQNKHILRGYLNAIYGEMEDCITFLQNN